MGVLSRRLAGLVVSLVTACAVPGPPIEPSPTPDGLDCTAWRGSSRGLLVQLTVPADTPTDQVMALYRDSHQVAAVSVADLGTLPQSVAIGDPELTPGLTAVYTCALFAGDTPIARRTLRVTGVSSPSPPPPPHAEASGNAVEIRWDPVDGQHRRVWRRDVLEGSDAAPVSPALEVGRWVDMQPRPGGVYAYSLEAIVYRDGVPWHSERGAEHYVEMP